MLASVPPFGSPIFEQRASYMRRSAQFTAYQYCLVLAILDK
jgi:hypothetical protein